MKGYSAPPKPQHYWSLTIRLFSVIYRRLVGKSYRLAEMQSVYSTAPAHWAVGNIDLVFVCYPELFEIELLFGIETVH